jgi:hypothetical protein
MLITCKTPNPNPEAAPYHSQEKHRLHNRTVLLLLFLIRPTKTLTLHLNFGAASLEFFEPLLGLGELISYNMSVFALSSIINRE